MNHFELHTIDNAPHDAKPLLEQATKEYGMLPGLYQVMASSPELLKSYFVLHEQFEKTDLSIAERNTIWLAISVENECHYCVPAHTAIAKQQKVSDETITALRESKPLVDAKLEALRKLTLILVRNHGKATTEELNAFFSVGFKPRNVLDILVGIAQKTLSNYTNHLADTEIDAPFKAFSWSPCTE
jgi:uncharacterized peroxidase-related enzyme